MVVVAWLKAGLPGEVHSAVGKSSFNIYAKSQLGPSVPPFPRGHHLEVDGLAPVGGGEGGGASVRPHTLTCQAFYSIQRGSHIRTLDTKTNEKPRNAKTAGRVRGWGRTFNYLPTYLQA